MDRNLDKSLVDALTWASIRELPPKDDKEHVWIYALALVAKRDGSKAYVAMSKDKNGEDRVIKDFGSTSHIMKVEAVYPYLHLDPSFLPDFKGAKKEDKIKWLTLMNPNGKYEEMTAKELNKAVLNMAIQNHLKAIKNA